jgi:hypothetical protein
MKPKNLEAPTSNAEYGCSKTEGILQMALVLSLHQKDDLVRMGMISMVLLYKPHL